MSTGGLQNAGTLAGAKLATTAVFLDDSANYPVLNVAHTGAAGVISLSAGPNYGNGVFLTPLPHQRQLLQGTDGLFNNTLAVPGTFSVGTANVANALNVIGPSVLSGQTYVSGGFVANASATISNTLVVGNSINVPALRGNTISLTGPTAFQYLETSSNLASVNARLQLSPTWSIKVLGPPSNGLAFQSLGANNQWLNSYVIGPAGVAITVGNLYSTTT